MQRVDIDNQQFKVTPLYVDLRSAFDSISRPALWLLLSRLGIPCKIIHLMKSLYKQSVSCVRANRLQSEWFEITFGVRQGCVVAPDSFATGVDWVMERATGRGMNGIVFGQDAYTDLDFADDISLLAELLSLLIPVLEAFAEEAAAIGLEVNWDKTKVQAQGTHQLDTDIGRVWAPGCSCRRIRLPRCTNSLFSSQLLRHSPLQ